MKTRNGKLLTKSKYLNGLQCPRYLWISCNEPDSIPEPGLATQHNFDEGNQVGDLAKKLYPGGTDVPPTNFMENIRATKDLLKSRKPVYEAGILAGRVYARIDILKPSEDDSWDIVEAKKSASVKEEYIDDVSFQKYVCEESGLKINHCFLAHINTKYVKHGEIQPQDLFVVEEISDDVATRSEGLRSQVTDMLKIIDEGVCPAPQIGSRCKAPFDCPLIHSGCWDGLPEHHVFTLARGGKTSQELYMNGVVDLADVPGDTKLNDKQRIQCDCIMSGQPHVDAKLVREFLRTLKYPLYFFDFETIGPAIPLFDGTRPYQNIPFQFSLHVQLSSGSFVMHSGFLSEGHNDPRPELLKHLKAGLGRDGSIVVYNRSFEQSILEELGQSFPEYKQWSLGIVARLVDLIIPFRNFHYYHPSQKGSASIKSVLPAITGQGYEGLEIGKGDEASIRYLNATYGDISPEEQAKTRAALIEYCGLDTKGMVDIVRRLEEITQ